MPPRPACSRSRCRSPLRCPTSSRTPASATPRTCAPLGFPVFSRSVCIKGTAKETVGPMCEPVTVGGVLIRPGDVVRADADGVVVVRREDAAEVATASKERVEAEADHIAAYRAGRTVADTCGLALRLAAKGLVIEDCGAPPAQAAGAPTAGAEVPCVRTAR
ncbi:hypothetical protein [Streptomyces sp. NPDC057253]|uniref:RraA family protein n=1 Tax=Streptomyces sp. NPDC057253 TaxID=3346069 RepID=UPI0036440A9F